MNNAPRTISGKSTILTFASVSLLMAAGAWWYYYDQQRRPMALWGPGAARLIAQAPSRLQRGGAVALEIGAGQAAATEALLQAAGFVDVQVRDVSHTLHAPDLASYWASTLRSNSPQQSSCACRRGSSSAMSRRSW